MQTWGLPVSYDEATEAFVKIGVWSNVAEGRDGLAAVIWLWPWSAEVLVLAKHYENMINNNVARRRARSFLEMISRTFLVFALIVTG